MISECVLSAMSLAHHVNCHSDRFKPSSVMPELTLTDEKLRIQHELTSSYDAVFFKESWHQHWESHWNFYFMEGKHAWTGVTVLHDFCQHSRQHFGSVLMNFKQRIWEDPFGSYVDYFHNNPDVLKPSTLIPKHWTLADDKIAVWTAIKQQLPAEVPEVTRRWILNIRRDYIPPGRSGASAHVLLQQLCSHIGWKPWAFIEEMIVKVCLHGPFHLLWNEGKSQDDWLGNGVVTTDEMGSTIRIVPVSSEIQEQLCESAVVPDHVVGNAHNVTVVEDEVSSYVVPDHVVGNAHNVIVVEDEVSSLDSVVDSDPFELLADKVAFPDSPKHFCT